jgi:uncharacterized protein (DUF1800 family)
MDVWALISRSTTAAALGTILVFSVVGLNPAPVEALTLDEAVHLAGRTGFGAAPQDVLPLLPLSREQAVDRLLSTLDDPGIAPPPPFTQGVRPNYHAPDWRSSQNVILRINERDQLQDWWISSLIMTKSPFLEHMVLFWHNIFTSSINPTLVTSPMVDQLSIFRDAGTKNYKTLVESIIKDPMMIVYLNNDENVKSHPNENLARELLELFTLGAGNYSQKDIQELARVLAGHHVDKTGGWTYRVDTASLDTGTKTVLGKTISGSPDDQIRQVVEAIVAQPQAANHVATEFYKEFVSLDVDKSEINRLSDVFIKNNYNIRPLLREILLSKNFWDIKNRGALIKSPVDLIVGFMRTFGVGMPDDQILNIYSKYLGQELLAPPNVAGWRGGRDWITTATLATRRRIVGRLWEARDVALSEDPDPAARGLRIRFGSESVGAPAHFRVLANGEPVAEISARYPLDMQREAPSNTPSMLKPMWETLFVPENKLPHPVNEIVLEPRNLGPDARLFINWVSLDGIRQSTLDAKAVPMPGASCPAPIGMLYCNARLVFAPLAGPAPSPDGDLAAPLNSMIEYGTARLIPVGLAAARPDILSATPPDGIEERYRDIRTFILPVRPILAEESARPGEPLPDYARRLTEDPAYNLK